MGPVPQGVFLVVVGLLFIAGNLGNGFIALVNCRNWARRRKMSSIDLILTALAVSRIGLLLSSCTSMLMASLNPELWKTANMLKMIFLTWMVTNHFSIWLATSLSVFYFFKIANFSNSVFLYLKWRVRKVVFWMILGSLVILFINGFLVNTAVSVWFVEFRNTSCIFSSETSLQFSMHFVIHINLFLCIPFTMSLAAFILLIFSLWRHHKRIRPRGPGPRDTSLAAHVRALQMVITFLLLYSIFFLFLIIQIWNHATLENIHIIWLSEVVVMVFPSFHCYALILGNSDLRQAWLCCCGQGAGGSTPQGRGTS
ncbi:taste receptor type 2 member 125-like [Dipodomys spectabilis]|uniref:taste receptor type 2 member 125-like n=1 Tax=Dipodomys spectabilis TaxID=105255 RepID=UPI001C54B0F6|nr:taste receptor type 2 member 125-like [Dipodomys spectabilis]